jgi:hypothetical protein
VVVLINFVCFFFLTATQIFVVDRSGSMAGGRINKVKDTLQIFLRSIPEGPLLSVPPLSFCTRTHTYIYIFSAPCYDYFLLYTATDD